MFKSMKEPSEYPCWVTYRDGTNEIVYSHNEFTEKCESLGTPIEYCFENVKMENTSADYSQTVIEDAVSAVKKSRANRK